MLVGGRREQNITVFQAIRRGAGLWCVEYHEYEEIVMVQSSLGQYSCNKKFKFNLKGLH